MDRRHGWQAGLLVLLAFSAAGAEEERYPCEPSPEVGRALQALPAARDYTLTFEERIGRVRELLKRYPRDLFVHHRYQDLFRSRLWLADEHDRALALYTSEADDPVMKYLHARLLMPMDLRKAQEMLEGVLGAAPSFAWPHLVLAELAAHPMARDPAKAERHLRHFLDACPANPEPYLHFGVLEDEEMIRTGAKRLRELLEARQDVEALRYYRQLWDLELRAAPAERREDVRARIRDDVEALLPLAEQGGEEWFWLSKHGSELVGDETLRNRREAGALEKYPDSEAALAIGMDRWQRDNPRPGTLAPREDAKAHQRRYFEVRKDWLRRWPNHPSLVRDAFPRLRMAQGISTDELLSALDEWLGFWKNQPDLGVTWPPAEIVAAETYVERSVRMDQVPGLIEQGLIQAEKQARYRLDLQLLPEEVRDRVPDNLGFSFWRARTILTDLYLKTKDSGRAREVLSLMAAELARGRPAEDAPERIQNEHRRREQDFLGLRARLAEQTGDKDAALKDYQAALQLLPRRAIESGKMPLVAAAKRLYLERAGNEDNWMEWAVGGRERSEAQEQPSPRFTKLLEDFAAADF